MRIALLAIALWAAACNKSSSTTTPPPSNQAAAITNAEPAPAGPCSARDCKGCIAASCQWDIDKKTCAQNCDPAAKNCLLVGADDIGEERAAEVCAGAGQ